MKGRALDAKTACPALGSQVLRPQQNCLAAGPVARKTLALQGLVLSGLGASRRTSRKRRIRIAEPTCGAKQRLKHVDLVVKIEKKM